MESDMTYMDYTKLALIDKIRSRLSKVAKPTLANGPWTGGAYFDGQSVHIKYDVETGATRMHSPAPWLDRSGTGEGTYIGSDVEVEAEIQARIGPGFDIRVLGESVAMERLYSIWGGKEAHDEMVSRMSGPGKECPVCRSSVTRLKIDSTCLQCHTKENA